VINKPKHRKRPPISVPLQAEVLFRDSWLCHLCRRPLVFPLALKRLQEFVGLRCPDIPLAYWDSAWRRDASPLLDELAASVDHVTAFARGGAHDLSNFAAVCARCNARKSARGSAEYLEEARPWKVKGKHGEPKNWDGFSSLFLALAQDKGVILSPTEKLWLTAIKKQFAARAAVSR
jgi:5-methylcytosine-specific restriction endonuclease McrA